MILFFKRIKYKFYLIYSNIKSIFNIIKYRFKKTKRETFIKTRNNINEYQSNKAKDWMLREKMYKVYKKNDKQFFDYDLMKKIHKNCIKDIVYVKDSELYNTNEYLATTEDIEKNKAGDCEDQAYYTMLKLKEAGFRDDDIGVLFVMEKNKPDSGHVFAILHYTDNDFYMLDNGHFLSLPVKAKNYLGKRDDIEYIIAYNLFDIWNY